MAYYVQYRQKINPGNYRPFGIGKDPITRNRGRVIVHSSNDSIARIENKDQLRILLAKYPGRFDVLQPIEVPAGIKKVLDDSARERQIRLSRLYKVPVPEPRKPKKSKPKRKKSKKSKKGK